jgi:hypothetical protein
MGTQIFITIYIPNSFIVNILSLYKKKTFYKTFTSKQTCFNKQCSEKYIYSKFALLKREMENC